MDGGMIVGYLVAFLLGGAKRFADSKLDGMLKRLYERVKSEFRNDPALAQVEKNPRNEAAQQWLRSQLEEAAARDVALREELAGLQRALQQQAPNLLVYAPGADTVVGVNSGYFVGRDVIIHNPPFPGGLDSRAPAWVKGLYVLGVLLCLGGLGLFFFTMFSEQPDFSDPNFGVLPAGIPAAFSVFFAGFFLIAIAALVTSLRHHDPTPRLPR